MRNKKFKTLYTGYLESFNKEAPLKEYPRPQMVRDSYFNLNGTWHFSVSEGECEPQEYTETITVPYPPESALSGIERRINKNEKLYYKKTFTLPDGFIKNRVILHFGAVDQECRVKLNGKFIGTHEGGYTPFSFDITDFLKDGENTLTVKVRDSLDLKYPYGKQKVNRGGMWYTPVSGIWQTVWLESIPKNSIRSLRISSDMKSAKITIDAPFGEKKITIHSEGVSAVFSGNEFIFTPKEPKLWSPESPFLYHFTLETKDDKIDSYFALRKIGVTKTDGKARLTLNGEPYLFSGLLDQGYFPDGIFTPADYKAYEDDITVAKSLGFNMLRKHIKIEPQIFYHLCDKPGMVVFQDMVNNSDYSFLRDTALPTLGIKRLSDRKMHKNAESREIFTDTMKETVKLLENSPSVLYYTIFNEGWGQFSADENYRTAKALDPTRIYDATSGWFFENESDVDSHHVYFKKAKLNWDGKRPLVLSEFGGYSLRIEGHLYGPKNYGYRIFSSNEEYERAVISLYENEILTLAKAGISALVYTQLSDVEDETNGFVTYDRRKIKIDSDKMRRMNFELYRASNYKK